MALLPALLLGQGSLDRATMELQARLESSLEELAELRNEIASSKAPLSKELNALDAEVGELRKTFDTVSRQRDSKTLDLSSLELNIKQGSDELDYLVSLMTEYITNIESRADPSERVLYQDRIDRTLLAIDDPERSRRDVFEAQIEALEMGIDRLDTVIGGQVFEGKAVLPQGGVKRGSFVLFGPASYFVAESGESGLSIDGNSGPPAVVSIEQGGDLVGGVATSGEGSLPLDGTLGKALAIASTDETLAEHILKGGVWVFPILAFAFVSLAISLYKLYELLSVKSPPASSVSETVRLVRSGDKAEALRKAKAQPGPVGDMLVVGVRNSEEPKELLEEILLEKMVDTQPKLERLLSVIAVTAATAPLLGLLGTVTGMINTFKLITIFGTGDAKSLSGGISEALITTEFGLVVAIPALIFHAFLSRRAKSILAKMERTAMSFVNGVKATAS